MGFYLFLKFSLYEVFHYYFSVSSNRDFVPFVTICNFIFYKCRRSTGLQKSANETLISPTIYFEHEFPISSNTHCGWLKCNLVFQFPFSDVRFFLENVYYSNAIK